MKKFLFFAVFLILASIASHLNAQKLLAEIPSLTLKENPVAIESIEHFRQNTPKKASETSYALVMPTTHEDMLGKFVLLRLMQNEITATAITNGYNDFLAKVGVKPDEGEAALETIVQILVK